MSHILAAGAARMKLEAENYEARIAALEAQLAKLAAENERLTADRDFWKERFQVETRARIAAEALSRTGAEKVDALVEQIDALLSINKTGQVSHRIPGLAVQLLERSREAISALEPAAPEGQQEPVATVAKVNAAGTSWNTVYPADALDALPIGTPLYTHPSEQAVTVKGDSHNESSGVE